MPLGWLTSLARRRPHATPRAVVSKVLYLRQNYHFGAGRIRDYLKRFHDIRIAAATVQRLLCKHGLGRLPANQKHKPHGKRWQRYERPQPGHRLQMDVKFLERIPGSKKRLYQFTAIDDCTRIRVLKAYDACNQAAAIDLSTKCFVACHFGSSSYRPTTARSSSRSSTGISRTSTSSTSSSARGRHV